MKIGENGPDKMEHLYIQPILGIIRGPAAAQSPHSATSVEIRPRRAFSWPARPTIPQRCPARLFVVKSRQVTGTFSIRARLTQTRLCSRDVIAGSCHPQSPGRGRSSPKRADYGLG